MCAERRESDEEEKQWGWGQELEYVNYIYSKEENTNRQSFRCYNYWHPLTLHVANITALSILS